MSGFRRGTRGSERGSNRVNMTKLTRGSRTRGQDQVWLQTQGLATTPCLPKPNSGPAILSSKVRPRDPGAGNSPAFKVASPRPREVESLDLRLHSTEAGLNWVFMSKPQAQACESGLQTTPSSPPTPSCSPSAGAATFAYSNCLGKILSLKNVVVGGLEGRGCANPSLCLLPRLSPSLESEVTGRGGNAG